MEYILIDDLTQHIETLRKYLRPVGPKEHPMLVHGGVREIDFLLSDDKKWVLPSTERGLSFATSMKQFKTIYRFKARRFQEVDVYAIDDSTPLPRNMKLIRDHPGHASLVVTEKMSIHTLTENLILLSRRAEHIGRIRVSP